MGIVPGHDNGSTNEGSGIDEGNSRSGGSRHGSQDTPASPAPRRTVAAASVPVTPAKLAKFVFSSLVVQHTCAL